ncbi:MAG TPA: hypothetical protein VFJ24_01620 [Gaiellales bacterium]|nr:hypothetical protein [Gaiellales bacterium]
MEDAELSALLAEATEDPPSADHAGLVAEYERQRDPARVRVVMWSDGAIPASAPRWPFDLRRDHEPRGLRPVEVPIVMRPPGECSGCVMAALPAGVKRG